MIDLKTVLVPTDFSELSLQALPYAWELARQHHAEIVLAHSCLHACDLDLVRKRLENLASLLDPLPHRIECRVSAPVDFLVDLTSGMDRALMILVTHAFRGTDRQIMGSVAERLVSRCPIAVLTLKTQRGFLRELEHQAEVVIGKQRHGPIGIVKLAFDADTTKFGNLAHDGRYDNVPYE